MEISLAAIFITSFLVGLSGALSPGPLLAFNIREAARIGFWAGPYVSIGHALLELLVVVLLTTGLSQFLQGGPAVAVIGILGGVFLLWMGWGILRQSAVTISPSALVTPTVRSLSRPLLGGILVSLSNPFWTLWWATIGLSYLVWARQSGSLGLASFYLGHILSDIAWYTLVSFAIASGRRIISGAFYRWLLIACGLFLWAMAGYFIASGIRLLLS